MSLKDLAPEIIGHCVSREEAMLSLIEALVNTQSHANRAEGQRVCREMLGAGLDALGFEVTYPELPEGQPHLLATRHGVDGAPSLLMVGHLDTTSESAESTGVYQRIGERLYGPGIAEMKAGLVMMLTGLEALLSLERLDELTVRVLVLSDYFDSDEQSTQMARRLGRQADAVLCFHPTTHNDAVIRSRSGVGLYHLEAQGRQAELDEAGRLNARSALLELAHQIPAITSLSNPSRGVVVNCGAMRGGTRASVIAERASVDVAVSCEGPTDHLWVEAQLRAIARDASKGAVDITLSGGPQAPVWMPSADTATLVEAWTFAAAQLGIDELEAVHCQSRGISNAIHLERVPVLDGLGPVSGALQTPGEWAAKSDLSLRVAMNTLGVLAWLEDARGEASWRAAIEPPPEVVKEEPAPKSLTEQLEEGIGVATMPSDGEEEAGGEIDLSPDISDEESSVFVSTYVGDLEDDDDLAAELASLRVDREEES